MRSAWIGCACLVLFAVLQNPRMLVVICVMIAAGLAAVAYSVGPDGFEEMLTISSRQNTIDERVEISRNAVEMFLQHPWLGGGIGAIYDEHGIIVHNSALWFLAEFGAVGFAIFAAFIGWFCVKGFAAYRSVAARRRPLVAGLLAAHLAMMGFSLGVEALYQRYWWLVMGLLAAAYVLAVRDDQGAAADSSENLEGTCRPPASDLAFAWRLTNAQPQAENAGSEHA